MGGTQERLSSIPREAHWMVEADEEGQEGRDHGPWSERVPQAMGVFVVGVAVLVTAQRHEFTRPNLGLALIAAIVVPWILDAFEWPRYLMDTRRLDWGLLISWSVLVLGAWLLLAWRYKVSDDFSPFFVTVLIGEMASLIGPRFAAGVWLAAVSELVVFTQVGHAQGEVIWGFAFTIAWMGGAAFRQQVMTTHNLTLAQEELSRRAVEDERHRLARDIHDLVAHSLAVTMLQLSGARLALQAGERDEALAALVDAEGAGRAAMAEIHRTIGLLGTAEGGAAQLATPAASDLPSLVDSFRRAGLIVSYAMEGDLTTVPMATGLAAYRVVQESLSNAVKHAPGAPVTIDIRVESATIDIEIRNPIVATVHQSSSGGNGLRGMAERAELLGGSTRAGNGDGTWKVHASLPLNPVAS